MDIRIQIDAHFKTWALSYDQPVAPSAATSLQVVRDQLCDGKERDDETNYNNKKQCENNAKGLTASCYYPSVKAERSVHVGAYRSICIVSHRKLWQVCCALSAPSNIARSFSVVESISGLQKSTH